jgi:hypothetical protein
MTAGTKKSVEATILDFLKNFFFYKICVLPTPNECKKKIEKLLDTLSYVKKSDFDPPL